MRRILLLFSALMLTSVVAVAQDQLAEQQPGTLFAYPMAPDTCSTLESRCNYIITPFWDDYDISRPITDMAAFERTFRDFVDFFRYGHRNVVLGTVRDLVNKAQSNTGNLQKLGEVAERALYGSEAEYWSDEVYVAFAKSLASCKQLPRDVRDHYAEQLARINTVQVGSVLDFEYVDLDGLKHRLSEKNDTALVLLFLDDSTDSMIGRLRLSTDVALNRAPAPEHRCGPEWPVERRWYATGVPECEQVQCRMGESRCRLCRQLDHRMRGELGARP